MLQNIQIGNKTIGPEQGIFLASEVGTTSNGNVEIAKRLIDASVEAGLDAVKFQIVGADETHSDKSMTYSYKVASGETKTENIVEMLKQYRFTKGEWQEIKDHADQKGIIMFTTVNYPQGIEIAESIDVPAYKISSWDLNYYPFLERVAQLNKPTFIDLGPADLEDFIKVLKLFRAARNNKIIAVHCYHTSNPAEMNLKTIQYLREAFDVLSGFSSPDRCSDVDFAALGFEPVFIEKRLTLNRQDPGHHHAVSLEPDEMKDYVKKVRYLQQTIGRYGLYPSQRDLEEKEKYFRRIVASRDIKAGEVLTEENVDCKRPKSCGLDPMYYKVMLGRKAKQDLKQDQPIAWDGV